MAQPTIEQLIDDVIERADDFQLAICNFGTGKTEEYESAEEEQNIAYAALLSRIAEIQREADEWHKMADSLAGEWITFNDIHAEYRCIHCIATAEYDSNAEEWTANHKADCPVNAYRALTARYSQHEEGKDAKPIGSKSVMRRMAFQTAHKEGKEVGG